MIYEVIWCVYRSTMNKLNRLDILLEKYVLSDTEEYRKAKRLIADRLKQQSEIKKTMKELGITEHYITTDTLEAHLRFKVRQVEKVDTDILPDDIKQTYSKITEVWIENLDYIQM